MLLKQHVSFWRFERMAGIYWGPVKAIAVRPQPVKAVIDMIYMQKSLTAGIGQGQAS
jgi:hypothetical protein